MQKYIIFSIGNAHLIIVILKKYTSYCLITWTFRILLGVFWKSYPYWDHTPSRPILEGWFKMEQNLAFKTFTSYNCQLVQGDLHFILTSRLCGAFPSFLDTDGKTAPSSVKRHSKIKRFQLEVMVDKHGLWKHLISPHPLEDLIRKTECVIHWRQSVLCEGDHLAYLAATDDCMMYKLTKYNLILKLSFHQETHS